MKHNVVFLYWPVPYKYLTNYTFIS